MQESDYDFSNLNVLQWAQAMYCASPVWALPFIPVVGLYIMGASIAISVWGVVSAFVRTALLLSCLLFLYPSAMYAFTVGIIESYRKRW